MDIDFGLKTVPLHFLRGALLGFGFAAQMPVLWRLRQRS